MVGCSIGGSFPGTQTDSSAVSRRGPNRTCFPSRWPWRAGSRAPLSVRLHRTGSAPPLPPARETSAWQIFHVPAVPATRRQGWPTSPDRGRPERQPAVARPRHRRPAAGHRLPSAADVASVPNRPHGVPTELVATDRGPGSVATCHEWWHTAGWASSPRRGNAPGLSGHRTGFHSKQVNLSDSIRESIRHSDRQYEATYRLSLRFKLRVPV